MNDLRKRAVAGLKPGDRLSTTRTFDRADTEAFGSITRDYNPVHYERRFAESKGFSELICHGLLTGSMVCEIGGQLALLATEMSFVFEKPVYFGDTITCDVLVTDLDERHRAHFDATFTNQRGERVAAAKLSGRLPSARDRDVLTQMVADGDPTNPLRG